MIFDKITNIDRYRGLHPNLDLAISYIFDHAGKLPERVDISGSDVYANTFSYLHSIVHSLALVYGPVFYCCFLRLC